MNLKEGYDLMSNDSYLNQEIGNPSSLSLLLKEFAIRVQTRRYEDLIIRLAYAYEDSLSYCIYGLPW